MRTLKILTTLILAGLFAGACSPVPSQNPTQSTEPGNLTAYSTITQTPTVTATPKNAPTATPSPTPSPTPVIYVVKEKDTLGVIAWKNGITVDELKAANPTVDPYMMPVGTKLIIPQPQQNLLTPSPLEATTVPVEVASTECTPAASGGLYCFAQVNNPHENALTNFSAEFLLTDTQTGTAVTQNALFPIAELASGTSLPLYAYFPPPVASQYTIALNVLSATNVESTPGAQGIQLGNPEIVISPDGYSASITGQGVYTEAAEGAKTLTITAVSYDDQGKVNGVRRLDIAIDTSSGSGVPFSLNVYSIQGVIARVAVFAETRP